jgi:tellurite resistance protein
MLDLELVSLFLSHVITIDGQIDNREIKSIYSFMDECAISQDIRNSVDSILSDSEDKISSKEIFKRLASADYETQRQAVIAGLVIAYSNGYFDPAEHELFDELIKQTGYDLKKI